MTAATAHNGGRVQLNFNGLQTGGEFPFLNVLKMAQAWQLIDGSGFPLPSTLNSDGYPTTISNGGVYTRTFIPTQTERSGNYKITWSGTGTIYYNFATLATGAANASGFTITPTDAAGTLDIGISAGTNVSNLQVFHVNDETDILAGKVFGTHKFIPRLQEANFGCYRDLNTNDGNDSNVAMWSHRKSTSFVYYRGDEFRAGLYAGVTTLTGKKYTVAAPSTWPGLVSGVLVHAKFDTTFSAPVLATTFTNSSTSVGITSHGLSANDPVRLHTDNTLPTNFLEQKTYYVKTVVNANTVTLSATVGGAAITAGSAGSGSHETYPMAMINVGSTGDIPVITSGGQTINPAYNYHPAAGKIGTIVYDALLGHWLLTGGGSASGDKGIVNGMPPELFLQLCSEQGANPWFVSPPMSLDPMPTGDYMTGLATYCAANQPAWMQPIFEGPNEPWNPGFNQTVLERARGMAYGYGQFAEDAYLGRAMSLLGQAISAVYSADRTRYDVVAGLQTVSLKIPSQNDAMIDSTQYVSGGGSAAKNWVTALAISQYICPSAYSNSGTTQQTDLAARYAAGDLSAATAYADTCLGPLLAGGNDETVADLLTYYAALKTYCQSKGINKMFGYEGGYSPDYIGGESAGVRNLKIASKQAYNLGAYILAVFQGFMFQSDATFKAQYPSQFLMGDTTPSGYAWSALAGTIYSANTPAWNALCALGSARRASNLRIRVHG